MSGSLLSRSVSRRRIPVSLWVRILLGTIVVLFLLAMVVARYYNEAEAPKWRDEDDAARKALASSEIVKVAQVEQFNGDKAYQIVSGSAADGTEWLVWLADGETHAAKASDGRTRDQIKDAAKSRNGAITVERMVPAKWHNEYAWEVFYWKDEDKGKRYYYDYYRFSDGEWLETYKLSKRPK